MKHAQTKFKINYMLSKYRDWSFDIVDNHGLVFACGANFYELLDCSLASIETVRDFRNRVRRARRRRDWTLSRNRCRSTAQTYLHRGEKYEDCEWLKPGIYQYRPYV